MIGNIRHACVREAYAPFNYSISSYSHSPPFPFRPTEHFGLDMPDFVIPYASPIRLASDISSTEDWQTVSRKALDTVIQAVMNRTEKMNTAGRGAKPRPQDVEIFCTTKGVHASLPLQEERERAKGMGVLAQKRLRAEDGMLHKVEWYASADLPVCSSCGSGPPS